MNHLDARFSELQVEPGAAKCTADGMERHIRRLRGAVEGMRRAVNGTEKFWKGEAGEAHRTYFYSRSPGADNCLVELERSVHDLRQIADLYTETERQAEEESERIPEIL